MKRGVLLAILIFLFGFTSSQIYHYYSDYTAITPFSLVAKERSSPANFVSESDLVVKEDYIMVKLLNARVSSIEDTNSMDPLLDAGSNTIEVLPSSPDDLSSGDVISFFEPSIGKIVIHRIVDVDIDEEGWFAITKGDNNKLVDDWKVRFSQIKGMLVGVLY